MRFSGCSRGAWIVLALIGLTAAVCAAPEAASPAADTRDQEVLLLIVRGKPCGVMVGEDSIGKPQPLCELPKPVRDLSANQRGKVFWLFRDTTEKTKADQGRVMQTTDFAIQDLAAPAKSPIFGYPALSPDGKSVAYVVSTKVTKHALVVEDIATGITRQLGRVCQWVMAPGWSPDGKMIAYYCGDFQRGARGFLGLSCVVVDTGVETQMAPPSYPTLPTGEEQRRPPVWSSDGRSIFIEAGYGDDTPGLGCVYMVQMDRPGVTRKIMETEGVCTASSPTSADTIYASTLDGIAEVKVLDGEVQRRIIVERGGRPCGGLKLSPSGRVAVYCRAGGLYCRFMDSGKEFVVYEDWPPGGMSGYAWTSSPSEAPLRAADPSINP